MSEGSAVGDRLRRAFLGRLRSWMDSRDISQAALARRVHKSPAAISDWFTKGVLPEGETMLVLPGALGVDPAWLFYGTGTPDAKGATEAPELAEVRGAYRVLGELRRFVLTQQDEWEALATRRPGLKAAAEAALADVEATDNPGRHRGEHRRRRRSG